MSWLKKNISWLLVAVLALVSFQSYMSYSNISKENGELKDQVVDLIEDVKTGSSANILALENSIKFLESNNDFLNKIYSQKKDIVLNNDYSKDPYSPSQIEIIQKQIIEIEAKIAENLKNINEIIQKIGSIQTTNYQIKIEIRDENDDLLSQFSLMPSKFENINALFNEINEQSLAQIVIKDGWQIYSINNKVVDGNSSKGHFWSIYSPTNSACRDSKKGFAKYDQVCNLGIHDLRVLTKDVYILRFEAYDYSIS